MTFVLTFGSTHKVLKAESILKAHEVAFRLDPAPKALTSYCDLVITLDGESLDHAVEVLGGAGTAPSAVYKREGGGYAEV